MLRFFFFLVLAITPVCWIDAQTITQPSFLNSDEASITINKIEMSQYNTTVYCTHTNSSGYGDTGWVNIRPGIFLAETYGRRKYELIRAEGIPLSPGKFEYAYEGQSNSFRLIFPPLPDEVETIDMIECPDSKDCFNFYGINLKETNQSRTSGGYATKSNFNHVDRSSLRNTINEWQSCRNIAISSSGFVALTGRNGYYYKGLPEEMGKMLKELNASKSFIDEIVLTEQNKWLILWGNNGFQYNDIPQELVRVLKEWNSTGEVIFSLTFNDIGDWIAISEKEYYASSEKLRNFVKTGAEKYGQVWSAHLTDDGLVVSYKEGYQFLGAVPENLKDRLSSSKINADKIKFLKDGTYFFADTDGNYSYNL